MQYTNLDRRSFFKVFFLLPKQKSTMFFWFYQFRLFLGLFEPFYSSNHLIWKS